MIDVNKEHFQLIVLLKLILYIQMIFLFGRM